MKTDYFHNQAYPTYLYYNPYPSEQKVEISDLGINQVDLYDTVTGQFVARNVSDRAMIPLSGDNAAVIVVVPSGGKLEHKDNKIWMGGVYIASETKPAVNLVSLQQKQRIESTLPLNIETFLPDGEKYKNIQITFAGSEIYNKSVPPKALTLDTVKYSNGFHTLRATVTSNKGRTDTTAVELLVQNEGGSSLLSANPEQLAAWKPISAMPGSITARSGAGDYYGSES